ncbi:MAG TPA: DUF5522 domain-containing protein [Bdellovibrio sp.]|uniref:DUF5522 domain-containing protein n=1 Tax=Bdellovibrio sp. TaxID=28201 RepID=UPI002EDC2383
MSNKLSKEIEEIHDKACAQGKESYIDPATGYMVFTRMFHLKRGHCCNSGCRHCPWKKDKQSDEK